jgi:hypothetical protein
MTTTPTIPARTDSQAPDTLPWQQDQSLSYIARGVLADILTRPSDFAVSIDAYAAMALIEGRTRIAGAMRELTESGFLHHVRRATGAGTRVIVKFPAVDDCGDPTCSDCESEGVK